MKSTHVNIPVFIPHLGCPNMCVFCNQRAISGVPSFSADTVIGDIESVLTTVRGKGYDCEIAFFGGSFTGIDRKLMISLLDIAQGYVNRGEVSGIRMSTRPDYINSEIIEILGHYTISAVELGIQSFSDTVLTRCKRGHSKEASYGAIKMLREAGFKVVGQMMIGLPGSTSEDEIECAKAICESGAVAARIYPTLVFRDTELYDMTLRGEYTPLTLDLTISRSADVLQIFESNGVECIRIGLCESENLHSDKTYYAGPNHPSLGELVYGEMYYRAICHEIEKQDLSHSKQLRITVPKGDISMAIGQKKKNSLRIQEKYYINYIKFIEKGREKRYNIKLETNF